MGKYIRSVHTISLNDSASFNRFLNFLKDKKAKVIAWDSLDSAAGIRSVMTIYRVKTEVKKND